MQSYAQIRVSGKTDISKPPTERGAAIAGKHKIREKEINNRSITMTSFNRNLGLISAALLVFLQAVQVQEALKRLLK